MKDKRISAVVLAAGLSRRMGQNKLLMLFRGKPVLSHILEIVNGLDFYEKILVTAKETADGLSPPCGFTVLLNPEPEKGQSESVRLGAEACGGDYYMFIPGDMPWLGKDEILKIAACAEPGKILVPYAGGAPKSPCVFPSSFREDLLRLDGDSGGRRIFKEHAGSIKAVAFTDAEKFRDVDTPEDFFK